MSEKNKESKGNKIYVLDTNIILNDAENICILSQGGNNLIILPETTMDEIDSKKNDLNSLISFQVRNFGRLFKSATLVERKVIDDEYYGKVYILRKQLANSNIIVDIITLTNYHLDNVERSIRNDRKIIEVAKYVDQNYKKIMNDKREMTFITMDNMCGIRAETFDLSVDELSFDKADYDLAFIKTISTKDIDLHGKSIYSIDPEYKFENYGYIFQYGDQEAYGLIKGGKIDIIDQNELKRGDIKPKEGNPGQIFALAGMLDPYYDMVLAEALAGSGKTLLAIAAGMRNIDKGRHERIVYIRNSVESLDKGEEVGFLSGNEEKFKIYNYPLYDTLDFIARLKGPKNKVKSKNAIVSQEKIIEDKVTGLIQKYKIETMWIGEIRGRTISNAFVVIDEIQNFSKKSLQTVLSRLDETCKVVCIGSNRQIDNDYINKYTNGLNVLLKEAEKENDTISMFATKLNKVERGKITAWAEKVFSDNSNKVESSNS